MVDLEAQKIGFDIKSNKKSYTIAAATAACLMAGGLYFGRFYTGWIGIPTTPDMYFIEQGDLKENSWVKQAEDYYRTDEIAKMVHGLCAVDGEIYSFDREGKMQRGWLETGQGMMYFGADGKAARGWQEVEGVTYYFDEAAGIRQSGWLKLDGGKFYLEADGARVTGWKEIEGKKYFFGKDGVMQTGWVEDGGERYLLADSGELLTGDQVVQDKAYLLNDDGTLYTGWYETDEGMRYYRESGEAATGWTTIDDGLYYFGDDLLMCTGSTQIGDEEFFFEEDGSVREGWHESEDGDEFFVCEDGFVPDLSKETGDFGRLLIREAGIDVAVYSAIARENYQEIVDEEDSAVAVMERRDLEQVIADRKSQGFELEEVKEGTKAYLITTKEVLPYVCARVCIGTNDGEDVLDDEGVSIWKQNEGGFCTYSSAGSEDKTEVIVAFWEPTELTETPEEDEE